MAKKATSKVSPAKKVADKVADTIEKTVSTPVRNSAIPKVATAAPAPKVFTHEQIAKRAFEISLSGTGGSESDNWFRAERELRGL